APLSPNYVPGLEEPEQVPPSPVYLPYVPELVYLEYMPPEDDVFPAEEQPLPVAATPLLTHQDIFSSLIQMKIQRRMRRRILRRTLPTILPTLQLLLYQLLIMSHPRREELYGFFDMVDVAPKELGYGITDTWDELVEPSEEIAPTTLQGVNQRVTDLSTIVEQETTIMYGMMEEAQDDRSQLTGRVNLLYRDRSVHRHLAVIVEREREARMARKAWGLSIDASDNAHSDVMSLRTT
nr:hypothetical protein [Tanacetum cinerariifolium]